jgi:hypothetical protein
MTIKFFGLFFMQKCGLSPVTVSILSSVSPIFVSVGSITAQSVSRWSVVSPPCSQPSTFIANDYAVAPGRFGH